MRLELLYLGEVRAPMLSQYAENILGFYTLSVGVDISDLILMSTEVFLYE